MSVSSRDRPFLRIMDESRLARRRVSLSIFDKFGLICAIIISAYLIYIFTLNLYDILTIAFDKFNFLKYLFLLILSLATFASVITIARKTVWLQNLVDVSFEEGIYKRMEPLLADVARVEGEFGKIYERLDKMDQKFDEIKNDYIEEKQKRIFTGVEEAPTRPVQYLIKYVILINITLAAFIFLIMNPQSYVLYVTVATYLIWWIALTAEFKLWNNNTAFFWGIVPVLLLPVGTIILDAFFGSSLAFGIIFFLLAIYAFGYYAWALYETRGLLPFGLHEQVAERKPEKLEKEKPPGRPPIRNNNGMPKNGGGFSHAQIRSKIRKNQTGKFLNYLIIFIGIILLCVGIYSYTLLGTYAYGYIWTWGFFTTCTAIGAIITIAGILIYISAKKKALYENNSNNNHLPKNGGTEIKNRENNFPKNGGTDTQDNSQNSRVTNGGTRNGGTNNGGIYAKSSAVTKAESRVAVREFLSLLTFSTGVIALAGAIYTLTLIGKYAHGYIWTWQFSLLVITLSMVLIIAGIRFSSKKKQIMDLLFGKEQ